MTMVNLNLDQLKMALNLHNVIRFQAHRMQHKKSVAEHSFRVAMLYSFFGGTEIVAAAGHDLEESITGDLPSPIKKHLKGLEFYEDMRPKFIDEKEGKLGKMCDKLELVLDLREQLDDAGHLPPKLMSIYEDELDLVYEIAKELGKLKDVKDLLKNLRK